MTDEAHNFAPKGVDSPPKGVLKEIAQEGRKYGAFLILATQRPTLLDETITAQLNTKFVFRTVRGTDIATLREETDLTAEEENVSPICGPGTPSSLPPSLAGPSLSVSGRPIPAVLM